MSRPPSDQEQVMKSMVDHPAGRHRYRGPHGDDRRVGHARPRRDTPPSDTPVFATIGLVLCLIAGVLFVLIAARLGRQLAGWPGAVVGAALMAVILSSLVKGL